MSEHKQKELRMTSLEERVARLEEVSDTNARVFSDSLQLTELCIQALQRAFDDNLNHRLQTVELEPEKKTVRKSPFGDYDEITTYPPKLGVDFKAYLKAAMEARLASEKEAPAATEEPGAFEFGG